MSELAEQLELAGYRKHVSELNRTLKSTDTLYQKRITDEKGTRYFINAWYYPAQTIGNHQLKESVQFEVQFTLRDGEVMNVESFYKEVGKSEQLFDTIWTTLGLEYCDD